jgi:hypothetical protein
MEGIVQDVRDCGRVLILRFEHFRPEAAAEDVVAAPVAVVEGSRVHPIEVPHPVREVRVRRLEDKVVVVPQQTADVDAPAVAAPHHVQDREEDRPVQVVRDDRGAIVPARDDVVVGTGSEVAAGTCHLRRR